MNLNVVNSNELVQTATDGLLYSNLVHQVEKDFILANVPLIIKDSVRPQEFIAIIREKVYHLIMESFADYLNLLYIIDIPEKDFQFLKITDAVEVSDQVTFMILKREYQKVWYRHKYQ